MVHLGTSMYKRSNIKARYRREAILKKTRSRCYYCKIKLTLESLTVEHLNPVYKGGTNDDENLVAACKKCNCARGGKSPEEMLEHVRKQKYEMKKKLTQKQKKELKTTMQKIGSSGGRRTLEEHGTEHYSRIAKKRWDLARAKKK